jgi:hypothetical protein
VYPHHSWIPLARKQSHMSTVVHCVFIDKWCHLKWCYLLPFFMRSISPTPPRSCLLQVLLSSRIKMINKMRTMSPPQISFASSSSLVIQSSSYKALLQLSLTSILLGVPNCCYMHLSTHSVTISMIIRKNARFTHLIISKCHYSYEGLIVSSISHHHIQIPINQ